MNKRRTHGPARKAGVVMETITGRKTSMEIAADHAVHPIQCAGGRRICWKPVAICSS